jgi:hypothetical protein
MQCQTSCREPKFSSFNSNYSCWTVKYPPCVLAPEAFELLRLHLATFWSEWRRKCPYSKVITWCLGRSFRASILKTHWHLRKWLSAKQVSQLSPRARPLLRHGPFEVCKQNRVAMCKRCGAQIPKSSVRISYPSTVKSGNTLAVTVQLHVECAVLSCGLRIQSSISYCWNSVCLAVSWLALSL